MIKVQEVANRIEWILSDTDIKLISTTTKGESLMEFSLCVKGYSVEWDLWRHLVPIRGYDYVLAEVGEAATRLVTKQLHKELKDSMQKDAETLVSCGIQADKEV